MTFRSGWKSFTRRRYCRTTLIERPVTWLMEIASCFFRDEGQHLIVALDVAIDRLLRVAGLQDDIGRGDPLLVELDDDPFVRRVAALI